MKTLHILALLLVLLCTSCATAYNSNRYRLETSRAHVHRLPAPEKKKVADSDWQELKKNRKEFTQYVMGNSLMTGIMTVIIINIIVGW